jgi:NAD(P)-dependent dehydrogenase (short-subunit alcohol dehydrogenase family)
MGRSHAVAFARGGADVAIVDMCQQLATVDYPLARRPDLDETARMVEKEGRRCLPITADVRDAARMEDAAATVDRELGRIDVLVANAGISGADPIQASDPARWQDVVATNLTGVFNSLRVVALVLAGAAAAHITGAVIDVSAGASARVTA